MPLILFDLLNDFVMLNIKNSSCELSLGRCLLNLSQFCLKFHNGFSRQFQLILQCDYLALYLLLHINNIVQCLSLFLLN